MNIPDNQVPPAWKILLEEYKAAGEDFHMVTRPYYSTGAFKGTVLEKITIGGQLDRAIVHFAKGQEINLFTYGINKSVQGVGLGDRTATLADTNQGEGYETNDEDFAIMGLSAYSRGLRVKYSDGANTPFTAGEVQHDALHEGLIHVVDPGSHVVPPEVDSPLILEDALFRAVKKRTSMHTQWNRKQGDYIGMLRQLPEGGAESYLHASGEPTAHNVWKLSEGYAWRREGSNKDSKFALQLELEEDFVMIVSDPNALVDLTGAEEFGDLEEIIIDFAIVLNGYAFYLPGFNA